jgi:geranylgeranyl reductase family protein
VLSTPTVVIVGAGPSGSSTAFHLLQHDVQNVLILDKADFPRDKLCGGGLTRKAQQELDSLGIYDEVAAEACDVPKPYIVMPSGNALHARPREEKYSQMLVLNRRILDEMLMRNARERGAEIREGVEVTELVAENGRCVGVRTREGEIVSADVVVVAAGARSGRFRPAGARPVEVVALEGRYRGEPIEPGTACLVFDEAFVPQYGWVFPESETIVNVGVAMAGGSSAKELRYRLEVMVSKYLPRQVKEACLSCRTTGFPIHTSYKIDHLVDGNVLYVGEAGSLVDPLSFEGISQALVSGRHAAGSIATYLQTGHASSLLAYQDLVRSEFSHFASMRWIGAILRRRFGAQVIEAVLRRTPKWHIDEERFSGAREVSAEE